MGLRWTRKEVARSFILTVVSIKPNAISLSLGADFDNRDVVLAVEDTRVPRVGQSMF